MEPMSGIEPPTYGLRNRCSATELHWPEFKRASPFISSLKIQYPLLTESKKSRARAKGHQAFRIGDLRFGESVGKAPLKVSDALMIWILQFTEDYLLPFGREPV